MTPSLGVRIRLATGTEPQKKLQRRLSEILKKYDLSKWLFTDEIVIDDSNISHSHPVLTLGAKGGGAGTNLGLLSVFLHEQQHWFLSKHPRQRRQVMGDLRKEHPSVKVGRKEGGARDGESTYLHLLVLSP